ncbi:MAG: hypothetical protein PWQ79_1915 [Thermococcaceae archaeon]|nr:hypothetical protein [Thermococcaceae archaeon]MDK2915000.1 hypothetical protein [Thermococcaceae archaeon]
MKESTKVAVVIFGIVLFVFVGGSAALIGVGKQNPLTLQFTLAIANIVMAGVVALQAITTAEAAKQAKKQAELMNESLIEMKKERMNIEYIKNEVVGYIETFKRTLQSNLSNANHTQVWSEVPAYSPSISISGTTYDTFYQKIGFEKRISRKIDRLLSEYEIELEDYNSLVEEANRLRREIVDNLKGKSKLVKSLQEISNEEAGKYKVKEDHIIKATTLIEELVTRFNPEERYQLSAPNYGMLGLNPEQEHLLWP